MSLPSPLVGGILMRRTVPSDNSCLFRSVLFCRSNGLVGHENDKTEETAQSVRELRQVVADVILQNSADYANYLEGKSPQEYSQWILKDDSWGGEVDVRILSEHFQHSISVASSVTPTVLTYGTEKYPTCIYIFYDGNHYDPLAYELFDGGNLVCTFSSQDEDIHAAALDIAKQAHSAGQFTDLQNIALQCIDCGVYFANLSQATTHGQEKNHANFREVQKSGN